MLVVERRKLAEYLLKHRDSFFACLKDYCPIGETEGLKHINLTKYFNCHASVIHILVKFGENLMKGGQAVWRLLNVVDLDLVKSKWCWLVTHDMVDRACVT